MEPSEFCMSRGIAYLESTNSWLVIGDTRTALGDEAMESLLQDAFYNSDDRWQMFQKHLHHIHSPINSLVYELENAKLTKGH